MNYLVAGLVLFLGTHSVRVLAEHWRQRMLARFGIPVWRAFYSLLSIGGFLLIVKGYGMPDTLGAALYELPGWSRWLSIALMLPAAILLAAAYVPGTHIKQAVGHPMMLATRVWAGAHLLSNGRAADVLLFGGFFVWALFAHHAARARDRAAGLVYPARGWSCDAVAALIGVVAWGAILGGLHRWIGGVPLL